jgi:hypothetical protein
MSLGHSRGISLYAVISGLAGTDPINLAAPQSIASSYVKWVAISLRSASVRNASSWSAEQLSVPTDLSYESRRRIREASRSSAVVSTCRP